MSSRALSIFLIFVLCSGASLTAQENPSAAEANQVYAQGVEALKQGDFPSAKEKFSEAAKLAPSSAEAHNSLGFVLLLTNDLEAAAQELRTGAYESLHCALAKK